MNDNTHSPFGPSALHRRAACPASYRAEQALPETESDLADEGHNLHALIAEYICAVSSGLSNAAFPLREVKKKELEQKAGDAADAFLSAAGYVDLLRAEWPHATFVAEKRLSISSDIFGTADLVVVEPFTRAIVVDWKFGFNDPDPAEDNLQLATYALGVALEYECETVDAAIVMAKKGRISKHTYGAEDWPLISSRINQIVRVCRTSFAPFVPTTEGCRYCRAAAQCPALIEIAAALPLTEEPGSMPPSEIGRLLTLVKKIDPWSKRLEQLAYKITIAGGTVPGWKLVDGRPSRIWGPGVDGQLLTEVAAILEKPASSIYVTELASPAQLEKSWGKSKKVVESMKSLVFTKTGAPRLVAEANPTETKGESR